MKGGENMNSINPGTQQMYKSIMDIHKVDEEMVAKLFDRAMYDYDVIVAILNRVNELMQENK